MTIAAGGPNPDAFVNQQVANFRNDYTALVTGIKSKAPGARIVVANLPNFAGLPYASGFSRTQKLWLQKISVGFSTLAINPLTSQGVLVVDLLCSSGFTSAREPCPSP